jgi:hypothetical protein
MEGRHNVLLRRVRVCEALAGSNFLGNWNFFHHFVLPNTQAQAPSQSTAFFYVYRWILLAATHGDVDPSGGLKAVLGECIDISSLDCIAPLSSRAHRTKGLGTFVHLNASWDLDAFDALDFTASEKAKHKVSLAVGQRTARLALMARSQSLWKDMPVIDTAIASLNTNLLDQYSVTHFPASAWSADPLHDFDLSQVPCAAATGLALHVRPIPTSSDPDFVRSRRVR